MMLLKLSAPHAAQVQHLVMIIGGCRGKLHRMDSETQDARSTILEMHNTQSELQDLARHIAWNLNILGTERQPRFEKGYYRGTTSGAVWTLSNTHEKSEWYLTWECD